MAWTAIFHDCLIVWSTLSSSTFLSPFTLNAETIVNFKIHFKCWAFPLVFSKDANSCRNARTGGDAVRRMRASVAVPRWRVVVLMAPPPTPGFCKGSRCAAAVKQESPPHPPSTPSTPAVSAPRHLPAGKDEPSQTFRPLVVYQKNYTRCFKCGGGGRAMLTLIVWLIRVKQNAVYSISRNAELIR